MAVGSSAWWNIVDSQITNISGVTGPSSMWSSSTVGSTDSNSVVTQKISCDSLVLDGVDVGQTLSKIQERLSILVPDPELLAKYEALQQAYEHYKTLEALCMEHDNDNKQA